MSILLSTLVALSIGRAPVPIQGELLKLGVKAPDFTLPTPSGGKITLSKVYKANKATLVNFYFVH